MGLSNTISSVLLLQRWLVAVACLRLFAVYIGFFDPQKFRIALIDKQPELVNDLYGRLFSTWTLLTCGLCLICARNPTNGAIYGAVSTWFAENEGVVTAMSLCLLVALGNWLWQDGATLLSFLVALAYMLSEMLVFKTMSIKGAASPMVVAGLSSLWMGAGWNYYTKYCKGEETTGAQEAGTSTQAAKDK